MAAPIHEDLSTFLKGCDKDYIAKSVMKKSIGDYRWDLGLGLGATFKAATEGLPDEAAKCQAMLDKVQAKLADITEPGVIRADHGPIWDIPSVLSGDPEPAFDFAEVEGQVISVRVVVQAFVSGGVNAERLQLRARAITALLAALNEQGYAVEMALLTTARKHDSPKATQDSVNLLCTIHKPGEIFDLAKIAFWAGHPAALRTMVFGHYYKRCNWQNSILDSGAEEAFRESCAKSGDIYIESGHLNNDPHFATEETAAAWVKAQVEQIHQRHTNPQE